MPMGVLIYKVDVMEHENEPGELETVAMDDLVKELMRRAHTIIVAIAPLGDEKSGAHVWWGGHGPTGEGTTADHLLGLLDLTANDIAESVAGLGSSGGK